MQCQYILQCFVALFAMLYYKPETFGIYIKILLHIGSVFANICKHDVVCDVP